MKKIILFLFAFGILHAFSQNVGIGTNNPLSKFHVAGAIRSDTLIGAGVRNLFASPNGRIYDSLVMPSTLNWEIAGNSNITALNFLGTTNANDVIFKTNNNERARILSTGNFGIGTNSPLERLHVNGNILANDGVYPQSSFNIGYSAATVMSDVFEPWTDNGIKIYDGNSLSHLHVEAVGHCVLQAYGTTGSPKGTLENTGYSALALQDKGGNVGIGTITPGNKLEITSATINTSGLRFTNLTSASPTVITAGKALSVDINGDVVLMPAASNAWELLGNTGTTAGTNFLGTVDAQDLVFKTNNTEKVRVLTTGQVGIGTAIPAAAAIVDITSTNSGFAMPRMTTVQRLAIASPIDGLQVYDTDLKDYYYHDGISWDCVSARAGTVTYFANATPPRGYAVCDGQYLQRAQYPELFTAIGTLYGTSTATDFRLPDLRGEFVRGLDIGKGVNAGRVIGSSEAASTHRELGGTGGVGTINDWWSDSKLNVVTDGLTTLTPPSNGGQLVNPYINNPATVLVYEFSHRPRNVALLPCIKY